MSRTVDLAAKFPAPTAAVELLPNSAFRAATGSLFGPFPLLSFGPLCDKIIFLFTTNYLIREDLK